MHIIQHCQQVKLKSAQIGIIIWKMTQNHKHVGLPPHMVSPGHDVLMWEEDTLLVSSFTANNDSYSL